MSRFIDVLWRGRDRRRSVVDRVNAYLDGGCAHPRRQWTTDSRLVCNDCGKELRRV